MPDEPPVETAAPADATPTAPDRGLWGYVAIALALALAFGVGAYLFVNSGGDEKAPSLVGALGSPFPDTGPIDPNRPKEGELAPDFALVDARDTSKVVKLSDFRGKAVIVNWYASWCEPCKREIPAFEAAYQKLGGQLVVLGVDFGEPQDAAEGVLDKYSATYPAVLDPSTAVAEHYRVGAGLPTTFFIDKDGVLRLIHTGEVREDALASFLSQVGVSYRP
jgi:peroxiredoxin